MADPKGPETGRDAKSAPNARPRPQTLDLSATDVSPKGAPPASSRPSGKPDKPADGSPSSRAASVAASAASGAKPGDDAKTGLGPKPAAPSEPSKPDAPEPPKPAGAGQPKSSNPAATSPGQPATGAAGAVRPSAAEQPKPAAAPPPGQSSAGAGGAARPSAAEQPKPAAVSPPGQSSSGAGGSAKPAATAATQRTAPAPSGPSGGYALGGLIAAALGGAALAVLAVALFGRALLPTPQPDMTRIAAAESKLDAVGRDVAALGDGLARTAQATDTSAIDARLGELSKSVEASGGRVGGVETELRALSEQVAKPPVADPALGLLAGRIDGIELRLQELPPPDAFTVLGGRIADLDARVAGLPTQDSVAAIASQVGEMGTAVRALTQGVAAKIDEAVAPVGRRVDQLATAAAALKARPVGDPAARLVVAIGALDGALDQGRPFAAELAALKAAGGGAELALLEPYAANGVPSRDALGAALVAELGKLAPLKPPPAASALDRFVANAGGVVKVTPKDAAGEAGDDATAKRARASAAAAAADIEGALAARGDLDEAARAATDDWARLATARVSAENALGVARTAALARLAAND